MQSSNKPAHGHADLAQQIAPHLVAILKLLAPPPVERAGDLLLVPEAAKLAAVTERKIAEAIRRGDLPAYGEQRDRAVKRSDLQAWIESRKVVHVEVDDADIERRMRRLRNLKRAAGK